MEEEYQVREEDVAAWKDILATDDGDDIIVVIPTGVAEVIINDPKTNEKELDKVARALLEDVEGPVSKVGGEPEAVVADHKSKIQIAAKAALKNRKEKENTDEAKRLGLAARIQRLDVGAKAKLARTGDKETRAILIKEGNKQISLAVLGNPRMTIKEIEIIAASRNVNDEVLRTIGMSREWCGTYNVILNLVNNPKCPVGVSLTHLSKILTRDLRYLVKSKGIPEVIKATTKKMLKTRTI